MTQAPSELLAFATDVAVRAGQATLPYFQTSLAIDTKSDQSPVTAADREAESIVRARIAERFPDDAIFGEEFGESGSGARRWIVDPIDGTRSFIRGVPLYGVMIALEIGGEVQLGVLHFPALGETVAAQNGAGCWWNGQRASVSNVASLSQSLVLATDCEHPGAGESSPFAGVRAAAGMVRTWGDCYGYALVATGRAEVMFDAVVAPWDVAALIPIVREAGGVITSAEGGPAWPASSIIATNAALASEVRSLMDQS